MTRLERIIRQVSDLMEFYLKIQKSKKEPQRRKVAGCDRRPNLPPSA